MNGELEKHRSCDRQSCILILEKLKELNETRSKSFIEQPDKLPNSVEGLQKMITSFVRQREVWTAEVDELGEALEGRMKETKALDDKVKSL